jgi:Patatin-like phospholipase
MIVLIAAALYFLGVAILGAFGLRTSTERAAGLDLGLRRAHALRVPIIALALLTAGPLGMRGNPLLGNLLVLESWGAALLVGGTAAGFGGLSLWAALLTMRHGAARFGTPALHLDPNWPRFMQAPSPGRFSLRPALWLAVSLIPLVLVLARESARGEGLEYGATIAATSAGALAATGFLALVWWGGLHVGGMIRARFPRAGLRLAGWRGLRDGYFDRESGALHAGHAVGFFGLLVLAALFALTSLTFDPHEALWDEVPALVSLLALGLLLVVSLAGASFFFDRFRVPTVLLAAAFALAPGVLDRDPVLPTLPRRAEAPRPGIPLERVFAGSDPIVIVCAEGGGIQAAGWTARVLSELDRGIPQFARHLRLFSGVSGGSVGGLFYLEKRRRLAVSSENRRGDRPLTEAEAARVVRAATRSALSPLALALVLRDSLPFGGGDIDRGQALEASLVRGFGEEGPIDATLEQWTDALGQGDMPAVIFNATAARGDYRGDAGRAFTFSTLSLSSQPTEDDASSARAEKPSWLPGRLSFRSRFPQRDISVVTAARASASFPWVSPMAGFEGSSHRLADGGYFDNSGVASSARVLKAAAELGLLRGRKIVLILVSSFPVPGHQRAPRGGLVESPVLGPLSLLLSVRGATQLDRAATELDLLQQALSAQVDASGRPSRLFVRRIRPYFDGAPADQDREAALEPPLSWHLAPGQRRALAEWLWGPPQEAQMQAIRDLIRTP